MSYDTTQSELESLFSEAGQVVEVFLPKDRNTDRPRGFAFVEFTEKATVAEAIERFDGHQLEGMSLSVREAKERQRRSSNVFNAGPSEMHRGPRVPKPKGSRRNIRARKRGF